MKLKEEIITDMAKKMCQMNMRSLQMIKLGVEILEAKEAMDAAQKGNIKYRRYGRKW